MELVEAQRQGRRHMHIPYRDSGEQLGSRRVRVLGGGGGRATFPCGEESHCMTVLQANAMLFCS